MTVQPATLARGPGRPASLYLARSKSISSSNPDLAVAPGSVDDEVSRILASKVGRGGPWNLWPQWSGWMQDLGVDGWQETTGDSTDIDWPLGSRIGLWLSQGGWELWGLHWAPHSGADPRVGC